MSHNKEKYRRVLVVFCLLAHFKGEPLTVTDFSLLLPNIFDDNTRADKERMKRMILRLQNLQSFYYYHSEKSFVSVSFHPLSIHPCFVTKQRWAQFCVKDVKGEKRLENLWPKCPPTKPPTSHFVHVEIQRYHLLEGFETRTCRREHIKWTIATYVQCNNA